MTDGASLSNDPTHLYVVAGYPTSGKSSSLWKAARERYPLFGPATVSILPEYQAIQGMREDIDTRSKLAAGFWCTMADIPHLNDELHLPRRLVLHLDLLLVYLVSDVADKSAMRIADVEAAFVQLFAQPALRHYQKYTVTTLRLLLEEIQRRWRYRFRAGPPANMSRIIAEKNRLILDPGVAASAYSAIHVTWRRCLTMLERSGKLAEQFQARVKLDSEPLRLRAE